MDAIGYLETTGLPSAIVAADKMLKTAAIGLTGLENTKGGGWVTVGIHGDVAAVSVAIEVGQQIVGDAYVSSVVLGNPAPGVRELSETPVFTSRPEVVPAEEAEVVPEAETEVTTEPVTEPAATTETESAPTEVILPTAPVKPVSKEPAPDKKQKKQNKATCNLCGDPKCPRKLGEPRKKCIHYSELFDK